MTEVRKIFEESATSESIFRLLTYLSGGSVENVATIMQLLFETMRDLANANINRSPEILASFGVYFALILRFKPRCDYYLDKEHYLSIALKFYYPYVTLFISVMLVPAHLSGIDIDAFVTQRISSPGNQDNQINGNEGNELRLSREAEEAVQRLRRISPQNSQLFQGRSQQFSRLANGSGPIGNEETVLEKTAALCGLGSVERNFLFELRRLQGWGVNTFMKRLGLKSQKHEMAIFLDSPEMLDEELSEDDIQKAIFMHANNVVRSNKSQLMPHHFDRALACFNFPVASDLSHRSDWVSDETLETLCYTSRKLQHENLLDLLVLAVQKNVVLCEHKLKKLPLAWQTKLLENYTRPRWLSVINNGSTNENTPDYNATLEYYRLHFCFPEGPPCEILTQLNSLKLKLTDEVAIAKFLENVRNMNKSFYIFQVSGYLDFLTEEKINFGNDRDLIGNDIFELSKNFVFIVREKDRIYLLDYGAAKTLIEKGENPYNRQPLSAKIREEITRRYQQYNVGGIGSETLPISELLEEFLHGRKKTSACSCIGAKNYRRKLVRVLRNYGIRDDHLDLVVIRDVVFKLGLIAIDLKAENLTELCENLYRAIKTARDDCRESLKRAIVSIIKIYSSVLPGGMLLNL